MTRLWSIAFSLITSTSLTLAVFAQSPNTGPGQVVTSPQPSTRAVSAPNPSQKTPVARTQARARRRSIVHHYPYPYPGYYHNDRTAGWRNPGGVGRYGEYYPPGDQFQAGALAERDPVQPATFGNGGIPSREEQLQAQQIGIQRNRALQQHIDNYARPYGYGFGVGFFGGFF